MSRQTKLWLGISLGVVVIASLIFFLFFYNPKLTVLPNPGDATVTLNDQPIAAGVPIKLGPGSYEVVVEADGYLGTRQTVTLGISQVLDLAVTLRQIPSVRSLVGGAQFPVLTTDERSIVYLGQDGQQFFRVATQLGSDGQPVAQAISEKRFSGIEDVIWSPNRALAVLKKTDGKTTLFDFQRYDFLSQEEADLGPNHRAVTWHPTESVITSFVASADGERSLVRRTIATGQTERLVDLRDQPFTDPQLTWSPDGRTILLVQDAIYAFDVSSRSVRRLAGTDGARGARWSPTSDRILVELANELVVVGIGGTSEGRRLGVRTDLARASWTNDGAAVFVAIATDSDQNHLERIEAENGQRTRYRYQSDSPVNATALMPASTNRDLWFSSNGTLMSLVLEPDELVTSSQ